MCGKGYVRGRVWERMIRERAWVSGCVRECERVCEREDVCQGGRGGMMRGVIRKEHN